MTKMPSEPTIWVCPNCGNRLSVNVRISEAVCNKHLGGGRPMKPQEATK